MSNYHTPEIVLPMLRSTTYPKMMKESGGMMGDGRIWEKLWYDESDRLRGCTFLSRSRFKRCLKGWRPFKNGRISIVVVEYDDFGPRWKTSSDFRFPDEMEDFIVELANLSDLHGIIKLGNSSIWLRRVKDTRELNIDATTMNRISAKLGLERM